MLQERASGALLPFRGNENVVNNFCSAEKSKDYIK